MTMIEKVARALAWTDWSADPSFKLIPDVTIDTIYVDPKYFDNARTAIGAMKSPSDELLLAPGEPYRIQKAIHVPREEGIELRRKAWNKIIEAALKE